MALRKAAPHSWRNAAVGISLAAVAIGAALSPILLGKNVGRNLSTQKEPLKGHQVMRGPYLNSGSVDAGPDPNWITNPQTGKGLVYVGPNSAYKPSAADIETFYAQRKEAERK